jgi:hypothetical protein
VLLTCRMSSPRSATKTLVITSGTPQPSVPFTSPSGKPTAQCRAPVAVAVLLAAARPALRELLRELLEQPQVGAAVGAIALRRPVEPADQHAHSYRKVTTPHRCGPAALRAQHNVVSPDGPEHLPTVYAMTVTQHPSAADDQGPGSGVHVRTSGQGTQWHQVVNVSAGRQPHCIPHTAPERRSCSPHTLPRQVTEVAFSHRPLAQLFRALPECPDRSWSSRLPAT